MMLTEIETGLLEMEALLYRHEYSDYLPACCDRLGRQVATLLLTLKQRSSRSRRVRQPPLAALLGKDKTRGAMCRIQQRLDAQLREQQQLRHLQQCYEQELFHQKGAGMERRRELQDKIRAYAQRVEQLAQDIAYLQERLENIRRFVQHDTTALISHE
jgi:hypothetical protein